MQINRPNESDSQLNSNSYVKYKHKKSAKHNHNLGILLINYKIFKLFVSCLVIFHEPFLNCIIAPIETISFRDQENMEEQRLVFWKMFVLFLVIKSSVATQGHTTTPTTQSYISFNSTCFYC